MQIQGNTVLITGGAAGIGRAIAIEFLKHNNKVIIVDKNPTQLQATGQEHPDLIPFCCDLGHTDAVQKMVATVADSYPNLNVLVNNAAVQFQCQFGTETTTMNRMREEILVNLLAPLQLCHQFIPLLRLQSAAAIINVTSAVAQSPKQSAPVYSATKAALKNFTQALRYQLEGSPIQVFELVPPLVDTAMTQGRGGWKIHPDEVAQALMHGLEHNHEHIPVGMMQMQEWLHRFSPGLVARLLRGKSK